MPRDSNGIYTLPVGNPVVSGTVIESVWANTTMMDIAQALTGSVPRDGSAALTGTLQVANGNLSFSGAAQRILGDFSNTSISQRLLFQSNVVNGYTAVGAIPNGTGNSASWAAFNNSDASNAAYLNTGVNNLTAFIDSGKNGTGAFIPLLLQTGGKNRFEITTDGQCVFHSANTQGGRAHFNRIDDGTFVGLVDVSTGNEFRLYSVGNAGETLSIGTANAGGGPVRFVTSGMERMRINATGNVGIGCTPADNVAWSSPGKFLAIGDSDTGIGQVTDGKMICAANNVVKMSWEPNDGIDIYGEIEGGEIRLWNTARTANALVDYYNPTNQLRLYNEGKGIYIYQGGYLDVINMYAGTVTPYAAADIRLNPPAHTNYTQLIAEHFPSSWVGGAISIPPAGKDWSFRSDGNAYAHAGSWIAQSDIRSKRNLLTITDALGKLDAIRGYAYERNDLPEVDETGIRYDPRRIGIVAQELQEVLPAGVFKISEESLGVDPMAVIGFLVQVCKELKEKVTKMDAYLIALVADQNDNPPY